MQYLYKNLLNLRRIAIQNHLSDDVDSYIEKCYRHYSKTYSMALETVRTTMAAEQVILVYMEDEMGDWTPEEIERVQAILNVNDQPMVDPGVEIIVDDSVSDDEWIAQQEAIVKREEKKKQQQADVAKKTHDVIEQLTQTFKDLTPKKDDKQ